MNLQQTVSKILKKEVTVEEAMVFANEQYGVLCAFNREWDKKVNNKFDYVILTEDNEWVSYGKQATDEEIQQDLETVQEEYENIVVFKAKELIREFCSY